MQPMTSGVLERFVLSKPYFRRENLILAEDEQGISGFVHCGQGPNEAESDLNPELGIISMLMVSPIYADAELPAALLSAAEEQLISQGAKTIYLGGFHPVSPYYLGLYGGSRVPGFMESDPVIHPLAEENDYELYHRHIVFRRELSGFRIPVDRNQRLIRRQYQVEEEYNPVSHSWWEACTIGMTEPTCFSLYHRETNRNCGAVSFWDMEPLASTWGVHAMGMIDLHIDETDRRSGLATFLLGEAFRRLQSRGVTLVEVVTRESPETAAAFALLHKLQFARIDQGKVYLRKL